MNVDSTAVVLPRAPPDGNRLLGIVFIGPSKFKAATNNGNAGHGAGGWRIE